MDQRVKVNNETIKILDENMTVYLQPWNGDDLSKQTQNSETINLII